MAGHNNKDGTMFGKTKYLEIGDTIKMTDLSLNTIEYEIFKIQSKAESSVKYTGVRRKCKKSSDKRHRKRYNN